MGKNKQNKKKNNNNKKKDPKEKRLDPSLADEEEEDDCDGSIRSDAATLPSSDDTIAIATAGNDCDISIEGMHLNEGDGDLRFHKRKRVAWADVRQWWDGECAPFVRILNDLIYDMNRAGSEGVMTAYEILQGEEDQAYQAMKDNMAETARAFGVQPLPCRDDRPRRSINYPDPKESTYSDEELKDVIMKWSLTQQSYLPSGKFNNLNVGRWGSLLEAQRYTHKYNMKMKESLCGKGDSAEKKGMTQRRQLQQVQQAPGPAPAPTNLPPLPPATRPRNMDEYIRVNLFSPDGLTTIVSLKWSTRMIKLKEKHSQRLGRNPKSLVYRYKGKNLRDSDTVKSLGMVDNDIIHVIESPPSRRH
ncbi:hypothetical protein PMAYCL1PPCAC_07301 [Pristionchus mayeri]|uniref:Ubiquitin-like domain-containing protein n=1 Tax=Pristionchus mayeri TaxID=1317129 RepID=A0AAN4ZDH4_9BILA|nr:hypothetical protein PMAYCL1PPCAC_07301 [Pristionchus mayeri]